MLEVKLNNRLHSKSKNGRPIMIQYGYYEGVPVIVEPNPLISTSYASQPKSFPYGDQIKLADGWFIGMTRYDLKSRYADCVLNHEYGHAVLQHKPILGFRNRVARGLWRLKGIKRGKVRIEESEADLVAAEIVGFDKCIEWLDGLAKYMVIKNIRDSYTVYPHNHIKYTNPKRYRLNKLACELSTIEVRLRADALREERDARYGKYSYCY
jgi:hypothetical protein